MAHLPKHMTSNVRFYPISYQLCKTSSSSSCTKHTRLSRGMFNGSLQHISSFNVNYGAVWLGVEVKKWGSKEVVIVPFGTRELISKFSGVWMLLVSMIWKMLYVFSVWIVIWKWKWKNWPQSWLQNNIKIKIN